MTDWLPVVGVGLAGTFTTLGLLLKGLGNAEGRARAIGAATKAFWVTVVLTALVYAMYLVFDENWLWYT